MMLQSEMFMYYLTNINHCIYCLIINCHAEITATSGLVVAVLLRPIGARGAQDVTRAPYWGPRGARCNL